MATGQAGASHPGHPCVQLQGPTAGPYCRALSGVCSGSRGHRLLHKVTCERDLEQCCKLSSTDSKGEVCGLCLVIPSSENCD